MKLNANNMFIKTTKLTPTILFAEQEAEYIPDGMSKSGQLSKRVSISLYRLSASLFSRR